MAARVRPGSAQGGFVLLVVLAALVVLSLLAASIALSVQRAVEEQAAADRAFQNAVDAESTRATLFFIAATQRYTFGGITIDNGVVLANEERGDLAEGDEIASYTPLGNEIRMDGTAYQGLGKVRFSLQDDRGRISLNFSPRYLIHQWLNARGVPESERSDLMSRLLDYQDPDDFKRLNGGESDDYRELALPPPPGRTLMTPLELRAVLGWAKPLAALSDEALVATFSISRSALLNVNTAPVEVLAAMPGWNRGIAERLVAARQLAPIPDTPTLRLVAGRMPEDADALILFPGETASLSMWVEGEGAIALEQWQVTPIDDGGRPWRTLYRLSMPQTDTPDDAPARPTGAALFADAAAQDP